MRTVSIVIPTFNRAELLPRAIESSISQTYPCEVIVCDHGSTDNTPQVAEKYKNEIHYIRREEDKGPIICWRDGIEQASGEIIHINYDDDWIDLDFIEKTVELLSDDVAFVYTNAMIHYWNRDITKAAFKHPAGLGATNDIIKYLMSMSGPLSPGCAIFRREDALKNLLSEIPGAKGVYGNNSGVGEDLLIFLLTALDYPKYAYISKPLAHFFAHQGSITINAGMSGKKKMFSDAYANARRHFLEYSKLPKTTPWESLSYFFRWNYKSRTLAKEIRKKLKFFLRKPFDKYANKEKKIV